MRLVRERSGRMKVRWAMVSRSLEDGREEEDMKGCEMNFEL